jgi:SAM-dependent methyltransferase
VTDAVRQRLRDRLPVNPPYEGLLARAYDAWIPVDQVFPDDAAYTALLRGIDGPALELGCGTGRPLLRWLAAGHDVEGIDSSLDMLAILGRHAEERGLSPVVHHGEIAPLDLGRTYAALLCPAGTFLLIDDRRRATEALASYLRHLRPGGTLALTLHRPEVPAGDALRWRVRRTGTLDDGTTVVVHEALHVDEDDRIQVAYNRLEVYDSEGRLLDTWLRRHHLRWWPRDEMATLLGELGYVDVRAVGGDDLWVTLATRP